MLNNKNNLFLKIPIACDGKVGRLDGVFNDYFEEKDVFQVKLSWIEFNHDWCYSFTG